MFGIEWVKTVFDVRTPAARDIVTYWIALVLVVGTVLAVYWILRSRRGLALAAIRDSEDRRRKHRRRQFPHQILGLCLCRDRHRHGRRADLSAEGAHIAGRRFLGAWTGPPTSIFIVVIGGIGTIEGPIVGVIVFYLMQTYLSSYGTWYLILLGALAIVIMLFAPKGIWGYVSERWGLVLFPVRRKLNVTPPDRV